ncbi:MAG: serine/threonine protein kinase [Candidatus Wallbacteria bacterium]|nr:serine/threonine protein kinase [Candidatus Wallbacteria bacterium]
MIQIPGYKLEREIASGSSGTVFLAIQQNLDRQVALKVLSPGLFDAEETRARFLRETKVQASLAHPALVRVFDAGFSGGHPWLAMELVEQGTLRRLLDERMRLPPAQAIRIALSLAGGLAQAHAQGIAHRDLKPENVLIGEGGQPKIADFGLAKVLGGAAQSVNTATGVILGTPGYIAPEAVLGKPAGAPADLYALGVMLYEMLVGRKPFEATSIGEILRLQLEGRVPPARSTVGALPPALDSLLEALLGVDPAKRPDAAAVEAALESLSVALVPAAAQATAALTRRMGGASTRVLSRVEPRAVTAPTLRVPALWAIPGRAWMTILLGVALVAGAAAGWRSTRERPQRVRPILSRRLFGPKLPPPPPPAIERVTVGPNFAIVRLSAPALPRTSVRYTAGATEPSRTTTFPVGNRELELTGLRGGETCRVEIASEGSTQWRKFRTLRIDRAGARCINPEGPGVQRVVASGDGRSIVALWLTERKPARQNIEFAESFDGGRSWTDAVDLAPGAAQLLWPTMTRVVGGLVVGWAFRDTNGKHWSEVRYRKDGAADFGPPCRIPSTFHTPALASAPDGSADLITWMTGDPNGPPLMRWSRYDPSNNSIGPPVQAGVMPHDHRDVYCVQAIRYAGRLYCFSRTFSGEPGLTEVLHRMANWIVRAGTLIIGTSADNPAKGAWRPLMPLTPATESVHSSLSLVVYAEKLLAWYDSGMGPRVLALDFRSGAVGAPINPLGPGGTGRTGCMAIVGGHLQGALLSIGAPPDGIEPTQLLELLTSQDGVRWARAPEKPSPVRSPRQLCLVDWQGRTLLLAIDFRENLTLATTGQ